MKRVLYLLVVVVAAGAFYVWVYPHMTETSAAPASTASASSASSAPASQAKAAPAGGGQARRGGGTASVVTAIAATQTIPIVKTAVGFIEAVDVAVVRPRVDGLVIETDVVAGQDVKAGDVLFKLDPGPTNALIAKDNAEMAKDQANADAASADLKRVQSLFAKGDDTQEQLDTSDAAAKAAQSLIAVDQAQLSADQLTLSYLSVTAPIAGRVGVVNTSNGNVVHAADTSGDGLLTITNMAALRASFAVPESDLDAYKAALAAKNPTPVGIAVPGESAPRATGKLSFIDTSVDTGSGTIIAKADADNSNGALWPGQYVSVSVQTGSYPNATTIPVIAVQQSSSGQFVYEMGADGKIKKLPISVVATIGDTAIAGPELTPGTHVVIEGQMGIFDGEPATETVQGQAVAAAKTPGTGTKTQTNTDASAPAASSAATPA